MTYSEHKVRIWCLTLHRNHKTTNMEDKQYRQTKLPINSNLTVVQDKEYKWGAIDEEGNVVIPFGKYAWIDGFQNGLAKVIGFNDTMSPNIVAVFDSELNEVKDGRVAEQGIVNEAGEEVLPLEYNIWKFYGKDYPTIKYFKGDKEHNVTFLSLNPSLEDDNDDEGFLDNYDSDYDDYDDTDYMRDTWDAMTDGQYGDMPEGFDGDFDFLGY